MLYFPLLYQTIIKLKQTLHIKSLFENWDKGENMLGLYDCNVIVKLSA